MEKGKFFSNMGSPPPLSCEASSFSPLHTWKSSSLSMEIPSGELNFPLERLPNSFLNLNWENSINQKVQFQSVTESNISRELIGRVGRTAQSQRFGCNGASFIQGNNTTNTSCYSSPLNSPPKLNLSTMDNRVRKNLPICRNSMSIRPSLFPLNANQGFSEKTEAEFPCKSVVRIDNEKISRVSSSQSLKAASESLMGSLENKDSSPLMTGFKPEMNSLSESASASVSDKNISRLSRSSILDNEEFTNTSEESSLTEQIPGGNTGLKVPNAINGRKRKAVPKRKPEELPSFLSTKDSKIVTEDEDLDSKRLKLDDATRNSEDEVKNQKESKDNSKPQEPFKDYIHVRARRGQATDSHSLAERVRREKISERMKLLQDLVPGCNKITGKAVMLDEIINYVQSLQHQVEFLSMKLATVNPRLDFNMETLLSKDMLQMRGSAFLQGRISNGIESHCSVNPLDPTLLQNPSMQLHTTIDGFNEASSQITTFWEDDLQTFIQMGFVKNQNQETTFQPENFHGSFRTDHMKVEL